MDDVTTRKGGTSPSTFPHVCTFSLAGADKASCISFSSVFRRNADGCASRRCNSAVRRCIQCIEAGRGAKANAATDPETGRCDEHAVTSDGTAAAVPRAPVRAGVVVSSPRRSGSVSALAARLNDLHNTAIQKKGSDVATGNDVTAHSRVKGHGNVAPPIGNMPAKLPVLEGEIILPNKNLAPDGKPKWQAVLDQISRAMADAIYVKVNPSHIRAMKGQPRDYFDEGDLVELVDSVADIGQIQPGIIRKVAHDGIIEYELLDGERRWRAVTRAALPFYKAMLVDVQDDFIASFLIAAIANFNRAEHTHMEISNAIQRLRVGLDMPIEVIAKKFNISKEWAYQLHGLQKLHPRLQALLDMKLPARKRLPIAVGMGVSKIDPALQEGLVARYQRGEITVKTLRAEALRVSKVAGTYVRQREDQPARKLGKLKRLAEQLRRNASDLATFIAEEEVRGVIRANPKACAEIARVLKNAEDSITGIRYAVGSATAREA